MCQPVRYSLLLLLLCSLTTAALHAQPRETLVDVSVTPDQADWTYALGETARFTISVLRHGYPVEGARVRYEVRQEKMLPRDTGTLTLQDGRTTLDAGTLDQPGFLRCWVYAEVDGETYEGYATAGFAPEDIAPTTTMPDDFTTFWNAAKAAAREVPLEPVMTLLPEQSTAAASVYHVSFQNEQPRSRIYGVLSVPTAPGRYPALLQVPGAGVRAYNGNASLAEQGYVVLTIGIHGVPVRLEDEFYDNLRYGALDGYWAFNLDDRDRYYYKRVYLGTVRAVDFLHTLDAFDGENLAVYGGSQGGALSIITAALDDRIDFLASFYPALSDHTGYLHFRAGGWPHLFAPQNEAFNNKPDKIETSRYYDVVNFARLVQAPGFYSWGYNDTVCPPTSMYAAYNVITAPKELWLVPETGHWTYPEQWTRAMAWLREHLDER